MVVFYTDIIDNIFNGYEHDYSSEMLTKLVEWSENDKRSQAAINRERK